MIVFENVAYNYGGGELLSEVTLKLAPGSFHFLTGPSGSGKTTLLKLAYAELRPTSGRVTLFDRDLRSLSRDDVAMARRRIGVVHQDCQFLDHLPLATNVLLPLTVANRPTDPRNLTDLLTWVGLGSLSDALPPQLSGGERQRAALARAIIMDPDVILADEPTGNLDWDMSLRLLTLLVELNRLGKTILIATHDLNLIRQAKAQVAAVLALLQTTPGIASARAIDAAEQQALLEPWFGPDLPVDTLPLPRLVELTETAEGYDSEGLRQRLAAEAPGAVLDDHTRWREPLAKAAARLRLLGLLSLVLIAGATGAMITLAANAALAANLPVIRVLRLVGAKDGYIVRAFVRRFTLRALGGAGLGTLLAMGGVALLPQVDEAGGFLTGLGFQGSGWLLPLVLPPLAALVAFAATRYAAFRTLKGLT